AQPACTHVAHHRPAGADGEGPGHAEAGQAAKTGDPLQVQLATQLGFDVPECFADGVHGVSSRSWADYGEDGWGRFDRSCAIEAGLRGRVRWRAAPALRFAPGYKHSPSTRASF